jgi:hypothetical protein
MRRLQISSLRTRNRNKNASTDTHWTQASLAKIVRPEVTVEARHSLSSYSNCFGMKIEKFWQEIAQQ